MRTSQWTSRTVALIEALHPDGAVDHVAAPGAIRPGTRVELVLASDASAATAAGIAESLAPDGIAWIAVPPRRRRAARASLRRAGLTLHGPWVAIPPRAPRALLPLAHGSARTRRRIAARLPVGTLATLLLRCGGRVLEELAPGVGLLAQRPQARPPLAWLEDAGATGLVAVAAGWDKPFARLVLHGDGTVVKSARGDVGGRDPRTEAALLRELGPAARTAGVSVPRVLFDGVAGRRLVLIEDVVPGKRAASLLRVRPSRLPALLHDIGDWIARWHVATRNERPIGEDDIERLVLAPARRVTALFADGDAYLDQLSRRAQALLGRQVPFAAAHNDLTMWNVVVARDTLGVVDWEAAERDALPLVDLDYAVVDAVAAARRWPREKAFERCAGTGPEQRLALRLREEVRARILVDAEVAELARHASWLGHARNEAVHASPEAPRPFLAIVRSLAAE